MCALVLLMGTFAPSYARADASAREEFLMQALSSSPSFRVRAQAAVALSQVKAEPRILAALRASLNDPHPAVKDACTAALVTLEAARRNAPAPVLRPAKYYVHIGEPAAKAALPAGALKVLREHVTHLVGKVDGVRLAPKLESRENASRVIEQDALIGFSVESAVNAVEMRSDSVRVNVAVVVATYPGRDIRAMLTGSATVSGRGTGDETQREATAVALESALRKLSTVLQSSQLEARASASASASASAAAAAPEARRSRRRRGR